MGIKRPDIDPKRMGLNPFMTNVFIKARAFDTNKHTLVRTEDDVIIKTGTLSDKITVEEQSFTKVFHDTDYRNIILQLPEEGLRLYNYIIYQLDSNEDYLWLNESNYKIAANTSIRVFRDGVDQLNRYGVICPTLYKDVYYINPMIFFCGNRLKKFPNNIKLRI
jgi:hypothetical protein